MSDAAEDFAVESAPALQGIEAFGTNPGALDMYLFAPSYRLPIKSLSSPGARRRPLVVVLHGCTQTAAGFDAASGWSRLAAQHDFLVLYAEQRRANNSQTCFSWFEPRDVTRGSGEVESIRQMIAHAVETAGADRGRVFVCGLSAGGAMAGALLAAHPELFRAGAIIAGLPYGTATNLSEAIDSMSSGRIKDAKVWGDLVRAASPGNGDRAPWPSVSVWHGTDDRMVRPINGGELVKQWTNVHGVGATAPDETFIGRTSRRVWRDAAGQACVTHYSVPGLGHGAPVDNTDPPAPFFLPANLSSTRQIARDWGLTARTPSRGIRAILDAVLDFK